MAVYTQILYHIVWGTVHHEDVLSSERQGDLYRYLIGKLQEKDCIVYSVGGYLEHLHVLTTVNPQISLVELVDFLKLSTANWIRDNKIFPEFAGWQAGFGAFTCSWQSRGQISHYIHNQPEHHQCRTFQEEMEEMFTKSGLNYSSKCLV